MKVFQGAQRKKVVYTRCYFNLAPLRMNKAKSVFIVLFLILINLSLLHVATLSWYSPLGAGWIGVFVLALSNFYVFVWMFMRRRARTSRNLHLLMAMNLLGVSFVMTDPAVALNIWPLVVGNLLFFSSIAYVFFSG